MIQAPHAPAEPHDAVLSRNGVAVRTVLMTTDAVGGVWRYSVDLARALVHRGVQTTLAAMGPPPSVEQRREAECAGLLLLDRPYRLEWMEEPWADVTRAGDWLLTLERTLRPDVVHLNGYAHAKLPWAAPVVVVAHSCVRTWWRAVKGEGAPDRLDRYTGEVVAGLGAASVVIAPTSAMLDALASEYGRPSHADVIPNGCAFSMRADPGRTRKEPLILAAGRVWDGAKNIAALSTVADRLAWPVHVAGECRPPGGARNTLSNVHLLGCLQPDELAEWYRRASIYVLPARYEPFGLSVLEAASAGCALVLGDIDSLRENWNDAALFVPPDDGAALAAAIGRLIDEPAMRTDLARRAFERAGIFTLDRMADAYLHVYERLVS